MPISPLRRNIAGLDEGPACLSSLPAPCHLEPRQQTKRFPGLLRLLKLTRTQAAPPGPAQAGFFEAPPGPVHAGSPAAAKVALFGALFAARTDVHAVRW